jgi:hypothetical protein
MAAVVVLIASSAAADDDVREIPLVANDLVWEPAQGRLYASVSATDAVYPNSVVWIDPVAGTIGGSVAAGPEPRRLALSDDGTTLYVALGGAADVRRIGLAPFAAGPSFALGSDLLFGPRYAEDLAVLPGSTASVAVAMQYPGVSPTHAGVAVFDDGTMRPSVTPGHTGSNVITFADASGLLYGFNRETTEGGFRRMTIDAQGVSVLDATPGLWPSYWSPFAHPVPAGGLLYLVDGSVVDPTARAAVGKFVLTLGNATAGGVAVDTGAARAYFIEDTDLFAYRLADRGRVGAAPLQPSLGVRRGLVRWGADGLAMRTATTVELLTMALVAGIPAPTGLYATIAQSPDRVDLGWSNRAFDATAYEVERRLPPGPFEPLASLPADSTTYSDATISTVDAEDYEYRVRAVVGAMQSTWTAAASAAPFSGGRMSFSLLSGQLRDSERPGHDRFTVIGTFGRTGGFDPAVDALSIRCGSPADPAVLEIPAGDPGWRKRLIEGRRVLVWRPLDRNKRAVVVLQPKGGVLAAAMHGFDFAASPLPIADAVEVHVGMSLEPATVIAPWKTRGRNRLRYRA